jgi:putative protein-disulfide isomerase
MQKIEQKYSSLPLEVLSGGMLLAEKPAPISVIAPYIRQHYRTVEDRTGIRFGKDFLWHVFNPDQSDWFPDSLKPAIALCILKDYHPDRQVEFASGLQFALHAEGRDLCDDEAYRGLLQKYGIPEKDFFERLHMTTYIEKAKAEFDIVKRLGIRGFPTLLLRENSSRFHQISSGYADFQTVSARIDQVLAALDPPDHSRGSN